MRKVLITMAAIFASLSLSAQNPQQSDATNTQPQSSIFNLQSLHFGWLSYEQALKSMPQYAVVQRQLADLRAQYQAETKRVEDEFNRKYEEFLEGQREFPKTILQKRQTELQELMEKNIAFKEESRRQLAQAEEEAMSPLKVRLSEVIAKVATSRGLALVVNTDSNACPFINPEIGEDINKLVLDALK